MLVSVLETLLRRLVPGFRLLGSVLFPASRPACDHAPEEKVKGSGGQDSDGAENAGVQAAV
jgi:hypothetical protein